ncbi:exodeoxyribonuclease III [Betaproteobacteria bacterium]|nr:exodeoxyribonuclease III [Betaproteobacteria bacterium]GHT99252.1 exodeoxyribonuclease III [Betaproteobacteria bacterium]
MKIATWNVNSLKVRLPQVLDWLAVQRPDVLCLQELKLEDKAFPLTEVQAAGYHAAFLGQKTYNGVAILSRTAAQDILYNIPGFDDVHKRLLVATMDGVRVVCGYFPNGQALGSDKFAYKLEWLTALTTWLQDELRTNPRLVLAGDFNIAPATADVHPAWKDELLVSAPERAAFQALLDLGLTDAFRLFSQAEDSFSWWDYRMGAFRRNFGLRIDHLLVSQTLVPACRACMIDTAPRKLERPSDHAPVVLELDT